MEARGLSLRELARRVVPVLRCEGTPVSGAGDLGYGQLAVQEAIAGGVDITSDVFAVAGEVIGATYRERWKSTAGLSAEGMIGPVPEDVGHVVREVCRALQWDGLGNIQMMRRPEGDTVVYEINPRTAGSIGLTRHAGFDFLGSVLRRVLGLNGNAAFAAEPVVPTVFRRDWSTEARCP